MPTTSLPVTPGYYRYHVGALACRGAISADLAAAVVAAAAAPAETARAQYDAIERALCGQPESVRDLCWQAVDSALEEWREDARAEERDDAADAYEAGLHAV